MNEITPVFGPETLIYPVYYCVGCRLKIALDGSSGLIGLPVFKMTLEGSVEGLQLLKRWIFLYGSHIDFQVTSSFHLK